MDIFIFEAGGEKWILGVSRSRTFHIRTHCHPGGHEEYFKSQHQYGLFRGRKKKKLVLEECEKGYIGLKALCLFPILCHRRNNPYEIPPSRPGAWQGRNWQRSGRRVSITQWGGARFGSWLGTVWVNSRCSRISTEFLLVVLSSAAWQYSCRYFSAFIPIFCDQISAI